MIYLRMLSTICAGIVTLFSLSVNAALVDADWKVANDNLITVDTVSGLRWLDITKTGGMSRDGVQAEMLSGGLFEGFRYATSDEVIDLWSQYGISLTPTNRVVASNFLDPDIMTASRQLGNLYGQEVSNSDYGTIGFIAIDDLSPATTTGWAGAFQESGDSFYDGPTFNSYASNFSRDWLGSYIVTTVPVPAAFWLFGSGLLTLIGFSRRS